MTDRVEEIRNQFDEDCEFLYGVQVENVFVTNAKDVGDLLAEVDRLREFVEVLRAANAEVTAYSEELEAEVEALRGYKRAQAMASDSKVTH